MFLANGQILNQDTKFLELTTEQAGSGIELFFLPSITLKEPDRRQPIAKPLTP
jgi:hypothetical protein